VVFVDSTFKVDLRGIVDLLSNHLYSSPEVYLRELLQNGVDAITARRKLEPDHAGQVSFEIISGRGSAPTLIVTDDGVGLTEDEVHEFLATIGKSSKRLAKGDRPVGGDFLGQFGIGLLSCFTVCDEITVITRSAKPGSAALKWVGRSDGSYSLQPATHEIEPGTQVFLTANPASAELFDPEAVRAHLTRFGMLLPVPIRLVRGSRSEVINRPDVPWRKRNRKGEIDRGELLRFGKEMFGLDFPDAIVLTSKAGAVDGVAFVLPFSARLGAKRTHRVYLKGMLLAEESDNLLPDWAFFVKAVVNADDLRPTAARESFYEDARLERARQALGDCIRHHLRHLAESDDPRLKELIRIHQEAIQALAVEDDDIFRLFIEHLSFETSLGRMTLPEYLSRDSVIRFVPTVDSFRQVQGVASAQNLPVINAGYHHVAELLDKYGRLHDEVEVQRIGPEELVRTLDDAPPEREAAAEEFLDQADRALEPHRCRAELKSFAPAELPCLYVQTADGEFLRQLERSKEQSDALWKGILDNVGRGRASPSSMLGSLCFNDRSPLVDRLIRAGDSPTIHRVIETLYVQALLLAHQPLSTAEFQLLHRGLHDLIEAALGD
jgi:molecular chaperone HtpG